jgi:hypothetical protein
MGMPSNSTLGQLCPHLGHATSPKLYLFIVFKFQASNQKPKMDRFSRNRPNTLEPAGENSPRQAARIGSQTILEARGGVNNPSLPSREPSSEQILANSFIRNKRELRAGRTHTGYPRRLASMSCGVTDDDQAAGDVAASDDVTAD